MSNLVRQRDISLIAVVVMDFRRQVCNPTHQRLLLVMAAMALGGCGIWYVARHLAVPAL
jgi:hypothetical protein